MNKEKKGAEHFDQRESVCCGGKLIHWFGNVTQVLAGAKMPESDLRCISCGKPCEAQPNPDYRPLLHV